MSNNLYPITFKGKQYYEDDCNGVFSSFYTSKYALRWDGSVYVGDGMSVYPNGEWADEE